MCVCESDSMCVRATCPLDADVLGQVYAVTARVNETWLARGQQEIKELKCSPCSLSSLELALTLSSVSITFCLTSSLFSPPGFLLLLFFLHLFWLINFFGVSFKMCSHFFTSLLSSSVLQFHCFFFLFGHATCRDSLNLHESTCCAPHATL